MICLCLITCNAYGILTAERGNSDDRICKLSACIALYSCLHLFKIKRLNYNFVNEEIMGKQNKQIQQKLHFFFDNK